VASRAAGEMRARRRVRGRRPPAIDAVLLDRDGTLIVDVPYNGDPARVTPIEGVAAALHRLRREGLRLGVVTNQSGIGRGLVTSEQVEAVNREVDRQLGPFDVWMVCPHAPWEPCDCRKPMPGMVEGAARHLGVPTSACAFIGDTGADVEAARRAGAHPVLVPNAVTLRQEIAEAPRVAPDLGSAVRVLLGEAS